MRWSSDTRTCWRFHRVPGSEVVKRRRLLLVARGVTSVALLAVLAAVLDPREVLGRLTGLDPVWVGLALLVSIAQVVGSAWRWSFTASRLGLELPLSRAIPEYYLATFLNQVLPGGVLGDISRAWRHAREADTRAAVQSVVFERFSGLVVMSVIASGSMLLLVEEISGRGRAVFLGLLMLVILGGVVVIGRIRSGPDAPRMIRDLGQALLVGTALPVQATTSTAVASSYIVMFVMAGEAIGMETSAVWLAMLAGPLLMTMLVPVTIAGWGLREVAAAALWSAAGLTAADGVAVSVSYGLIVLVSSLPGAVVLGLTFLRDEDPDRTRRQSPIGSVGRVDDVPDPESESLEG